MRDVPYDAYFVPDPPAGFGGIIPFLGYLLKTIFLGSLLATVSLASYAAFYQRAMPNLVASERLYFDYSAPSSLPLPLSLSQSHSLKLFSRGASVVESGRFIVPRASLDLFAQHSAWNVGELSCESVLPRPKVRGTRLLQSQQSYFFEIQLVLPDSEANKNAGMFTVVTELYSSNGTHLALSARSARYPHRTPWISTTRQLVWLVPLLTGAAEEVTIIVLSPYRHYVESEEFPLQHVRVKVLSDHPVDPTNNRRSPVEVIGGRLRIGEELGWFQELLKEWFFSCLIVGTSAFAITYFAWWHLLRALGSHLRQRYGHADYDDELHGDPPCDLDLDADDGADGVSLGSHREEFRSRRQRSSCQRADDGHATVVEDDHDNWEDLRRRGRGAGIEDRSSDEDSFSTPPQG
jgi:hypothetical protein